MTEEKYAVEQVNLRVECRTALNMVQDLLSEHLGFRVTQHQAITYLLNDFIKRRRAALGAESEAWKKAT